MQIIGCQLDIAWEDREANLAEVRRRLEGASLEAGALVVLPEMFASGFSMKVAAISEGTEQPTVRALEQIARDHNIFILAGIVTDAPGGRGYNEAIALNPQGQILARYRKLHPFTYGGEDRHFARGSEIELFEWRGMKVAPFVCYDLRFPEIFRIAVQRGAELFPVIANWPASREGHWTTLLRARAIENQAYVIGVNRCGNDPKLAYSGRSQVIDPKGEVLADAGSAEGLVMADVDRGALESYRQSFPVLADIRPAP